MSTIRVVVPPPPPERHPVHVYLASLQRSSRAVTRRNLDLAAMVLTAGQADLESLDWSSLRWDTILTLRERLADEFDPSRIGSVVSAVRGAARAAFELGLMPEDEWVLVRDVGKRASGLNAAKSDWRGELRARLSAVLADRARQRAAAGESVLGEG